MAEEEQDQMEAKGSRRTLRQMAAASGGTFIGGRTKKARWKLEVEPETGEGNQGTEGAGV